MAKINVSFLLFSENLDPNVVTNYVNIIPTRSLKKGDPLTSDKHRSRKDGCWEISSGYQDSLDINDQLDAVCKILLPNKKLFKEVIQTNNLSAKFDIVIEINDGIAPGMSLQRKILTLANEFDAVFDFDLYVD